MSEMNIKIFSLVMLIQILVAIIMIEEVLLDIYFNYLICLQFAGTQKGQHLWQIHLQRLNVWLFLKCMLIKIVSGYRKDF